MSTFSTPGFVPVLRVRGPGHRPVSLRGGGIYSHHDGKLVDFDLPGITAWVELSYSKLPEPARRYVDAEARRRALAEIGAPLAQLAELERQRDSALLELRRLHTSTLRVNVGNRPGTIGRLAAIRNGGINRVGLR